MSSFPALPNGGSKRTRRMRSVQGQLGGNEKKKGKNRSRGKGKNNANQVPDLTGHPEEFLALEKSGAPPFLIKTYQLISQCEDELAEWSDGGETFTVKDTAQFAKKEIPKYFEHNNFSSFSRQLNFYGFKKVPQKAIRIDQEGVKNASGHVRFYNEKFKRGHISLLAEIMRSTKTAAVGTQSEEVQALTSRVASLETQLSNMKYDFENLQQQVKSFFYQQGSDMISHGQNQTQSPMHNSSTSTSDMNAGAAAYEPSTAYDPSTTYEPSTVYEPSNTYYGTTHAAPSTATTRTSAGSARVMPSMPPPPISGISRLLSAGGFSLGDADLKDLDNLDFSFSGPERVPSYANVVHPSAEVSNLRRMGSLTLRNEAPRTDIQGQAQV